MNTNKLATKENPSRWQHLQPTPSRTNGILLAATEHLRAASGITLPPTTYIYHLALGNSASRDIWNASSNDADVPFQWFCVVCPKAARHIHLWNKAIPFLPFSPCGYVEKPADVGYLSPSYWTQGVSVFGLILLQYILHYCMRWLLGDLKQKRKWMFF